MRGFWVGAALLLSGCSSEVFGDDPIFVAATLLQADGAPWDGREVALSRGEDLLDCEALSPFHTAVTDAQGALFAELTVSEVSVADGSRCLGFDLVDGAQATVRVRVQPVHGLDVPLPAIRSWRPQPALLGTAEAPAIAFTAAPLNEDRVQHLVRWKAGGAVAWEGPARAEGTPLSVSLEDFPALEAEVVGFDFFRRPVEQLLGARGTQAVRVEVRSAAIPLPQPAAQVPASRDGGCDLPGHSRCPLTDGALLPVALGDAPAVAVRLPSPVVPRLALIRGLAGPGTDVRIEGRGDATSAWQTLGELRAAEAEFEAATSTWGVLARPSPERFLAIPLQPPGFSVAEVQLSTWQRGSAVPVGSLRELSLFE